MKELKVTKVEINLEGKKVELEVKHNIPHKRRAYCARVYAESIVKNDGTFEPWLRPVFCALFLFSEYAGMKLPNNWTDDETIEFMKTDDYKAVWDAIDTQEFADMITMAEELVAHRKQTCRKNSFVEFTDTIQSFLNSIVNAYKEAPEAADQLVSALVYRIFGGIGSLGADLDSIDEDDFAEEEMSEPNEGEANADV